MALEVIRYRQLRTALAELRLLELVGGRTDHDAPEHHAEVTRWAEHGRRALDALTSAEAAPWLETWVTEPDVFVRSVQAELDSALAHLAA